MSASLALMHAADASPLDRAAAFQELREMVLNTRSATMPRRWMRSSPCVRRVSSRYRAPS
jgi:hypothetical protein